MELQPNNFDQIVQIIKGFIFLLPQLFVVISVCYCMNKRGLKTDTILMIIGSGLGLLISVFYQIVPIFFFDDIQPSYLNTVFEIVGGFSFLASLLFAIGFYLLILTITKQSQHSQTNKN